LSALALKPYGALNLEYLSIPKHLPDFPKSEIIGRTVDPGVDLRSSPTNDPSVNNSITKLGADTLVEWGRQVIGNVLGGLTNQRYVETPNGFIYSSVLQPTRNLPNTPIAEMPAGQQGFWAEVTVPYVDLAHEGVVASPWLQDHIAYNFPPRLYYGQVVWMDRRCCRQLPKARLFGKLQQTLHPLRLVRQMQGRDKQGHQCCRIGHALILFETANLRIAVSDQKGELALGEFFLFAQVFEQVAKGGKFFR